MQLNLPPNAVKKMIAPSLQRLIDTLSRSAHSLPQLKFKELVVNCQITSQALMPWADFDHPVADSYGRQLVHHGGHFEVMVMSWLPGDCSAITIMVQRNGERCNALVRQSITFIGFR